MHNMKYHEESKAGKIYDGKVIALLAGSQSIRHFLLAVSIELAYTFNFWSAASRALAQVLQNSFMK